MPLPMPRLGSPPFENFDSPCTWTEDEWKAIEARLDAFSDSEMDSLLESVASINKQKASHDERRALIASMESGASSQPNYTPGPHTAHLKALQKSIKRSNGNAVAYFMFELLEVHKVDPCRICEVLHEASFYLIHDDFGPLILGVEIDVRMASKPFDIEMKASLCRLAAQLTHAEKGDWTQVEDMNGNLLPVDPRDNQPEGRLDLCSRYPEEMDTETYPFIMNLIRREKLRYLPKAND